MNVFPFVEAEKAEQRNVAKACALLDVSRFAFYDSHHHQLSARQVADDELAERNRGDLERVAWHPWLAAGARPVAP